MKVPNFHNYTTTFIYIIDYYYIISNMTVVRCSCL